MKKIITSVCVMAGLSLSAGNAPFLIMKNPQSKVFSERGGLLTTQPRRADAEGHSNIAIKLNLTQLAFKNISLQAEYGFHKKMSVALGYSRLMERDFPGMFYDEGSDLFSVPRYSGWAITPEFRFYPGGKEEKPAPRGFYLAPYLRYAKYTITQTVTYEDDSNPNNVKTHAGIATQTYGGTNGGLMIGYHWIFGNHVSFDFWIIGGGYGRAKYGYTLTYPGINLSASQQAEVKQQIETYFGDQLLFSGEPVVTTTNNSATMTVGGLPMMSVRFLGLCLGYAF